MSKTRYPSNGNAPVDFGFAAADEYERHDLWVTVNARCGTWLTRAIQDLVIISTSIKKKNQGKKMTKKMVVLCHEKTKG